MDGKMENEDKISMRCEGGSVNLGDSQTLHLPEIRTRSQAMTNDLEKFLTADVRTLTSSL